jgi:hypothetical protein
MAKKNNAAATAEAQDARRSMQHEYDGENSSDLMPFTVPWQWGRIFLTQAGDVFQAIQMSTAARATVHARHMTGICVPYRCHDKHAQHVISPARQSSRT